MYTTISFYYYLYIIFYNEIAMGLGKQAKTLTKNQIDLTLALLQKTTYYERNKLVLLLSVKAGLRAKEIASLTWGMLMNADGSLASEIALTNSASKGKSGRIIPLNRELRSCLADQLSVVAVGKTLDQIHDRHVISTQRSDAPTPQVIVNMLNGWYRKAGLVGCSSHSGRHTFITNAARKISTVGGSLRDVQTLAGHASLQTTQRYIDGDSEARRKVVNLV